VYDKLLKFRQSFIITLYRSKQRFALLMVILYRNL